MTRLTGMTPSAIRLSNACFISAPKPNSATALFFQRSKPVILALPANTFDGFTGGYNEIDTFTNRVNRGLKPFEIAFRPEPDDTAAIGTAIPLDRDGIR